MSVLGGGELLMLMKPLGYLGVKSVSHHSPHALACPMSSKLFHKSIIGYNILINGAYQLYYSYFN